jgi:aryl-alcohol dehydrogenase-like predicted oxidoreductase
MIQTHFLLGGELSIHRLGFGAMRLCAQPGNFGPYPDWAAGKALLRRALELGVNFIDTAHAYGPGWNESLIGEALSEAGEHAIVATKGGVEKTAPDKVFPDGRPEQLRLRCEESLRRLRSDRIDLYQLHRPDPAVSFCESVGALAQLRTEGKIRCIGLSNVSLEQLREALTITPIASVQNRYNLDERGDEDVLQFCASHGIAYIPWGPLAAKPFAPDAPLSRDERLGKVARDLQATAGQVALAWLLHHSPNIVLIPGTTSAKHLEENVAAARISLDPQTQAAAVRQSS